MWAETGGEAETAAGKEENGTVMGIPPGRSSSSSSSSTSKVSTSLGEASSSSTCSSSSSLRLDSSSSTTERGVGTAGGILRKKSGLGDPGMCGVDGLCGEEVSPGGVCGRGSAGWALDGEESEPLDSARPGVPGVPGVLEG